MTEELLNSLADWLGVKVESLRKAGEAAETCWPKTKPVYIYRNPRTKRSTRLSDRVPRSTDKYIVLGNGKWQAPAAFLGWLAERNNA